MTSISSCEPIKLIFRKIMSIRSVHVVQISPTLGEMTWETASGMDSSPERGYIGYVHGPQDGKQGLGCGFPIRPTDDQFFIFGVPKWIFFFVKQVQGAQFSIARNLCAVIGDRLRTTYHMPYARISFLRILAASCGAPLNPLETDRI